MTTISVRDQSTYPLMLKHLRAGVSALSLAVVVAPLTFPQEARATECANTGVQVTPPNDAGIANNTACGNSADATGGQSVALGNNSFASGASSVAIGGDTSAGGAGAGASALGAIAIGAESGAQGAGSIAIGADLDAANDITGAFAAAAGSTAIGVDARALQIHGTALGEVSTSNGNSAIAIGFDSNALNTGALAISTGFGGSDATGEFAIGFGSNVRVSNQQSLGIGANTSVSGSFSSAVGNANNVSGSQSHVFGNSNTASASFASILGISNTVSGVSATAIGIANRAIGSASIAAGASSRAFGSNSVAIGQGGSANVSPTGVANGFNNAIAIGTSAQAPAEASIAIGLNSRAIGPNAVALGTGFRDDGSGNNIAGATDFGAIAAGIEARAAGFVSSAFGFRSAATGGRSVAIGPGASATARDSVAIGRNSVADGINTVSVGAPGATRRIVNVARAVNPTDAVNLAQVQALLASRAPVVLATASSGSAIIGTGDGDAFDTLPPESAAGDAADDKRRDGKRAASATSRRSTRTAKALPSTSCELSGANMTTAVGDQTSTLSKFSLVQQSGIVFQQGGSRPGCVTVSFSAEVMAPGSAMMELRAVLDGKVEASPGPVLFAEAVEGMSSRAFNFVFPNVPPGTHRVELEFRNAGEPGSVLVGQRTTMVQFAR